jgi:hypothetical protein
LVCLEIVYPKIRWLQFITSFSPLHWGVIPESPHFSVSNWFVMRRKNSARSYKGSEGFHLHGGPLTEVRIVVINPHSWPYDNSFRYVNYDEIQPDKFQWIGLREILQKAIDVPIKYGVFL